MLLILGLAIMMCGNLMAQGGRNHRHHGDHRDNGKSRDQHFGKRDLAQKVYRITNADSVQKTKMKPTVDRAAKRLEALRLGYQKQEKRVLDSLSLQLKPYLKEDQLKRLTDWRDSGKK